MKHFHTPISTTASITIGDFFSDINVRVNASNVFRRNEKGFRVYTRLKDTNDRFILFLDADYEEELELTCLTNIQRGILLVILVQERWLM